MHLKLTFLERLDLRVSYQECIKDKEQQENIFSTPRHNQYLMNEIAPFPDNRKKYKVGETYQSILFIGNGFGIWSGKKCKNSYNVISIDTVQTDTIWTINSKSDIDGKINILIFKFSSVRGFILFDYAFFNGDKETLILKE